MPKKMFFVPVKVGRAKSYPSKSLNVPYPLHISKCYCQVLPVKNHHRHSGTLSKVMEKSIWQIAGETRLLPSLLVKA